MFKAQIRDTQPQTGYEARKIFVFLVLRQKYDSLASSGTIYRIDSGRNSPFESPWINRVWNKGQLTPGEPQLLHVPTYLRKIEARKTPSPQILDTIHNKKLGQ